MNINKLFYSLNLVVLLTGFTVTAFPQQIAINEFMSSNACTIADEDGNYEDWIELYNYGSDPVSLYGYGLSDNSGNPFKWVFPDTTIQPGQYLIVWASGKDRKPVGEIYGHGLTREVYTGIPGTAVFDLTGHISFPDNPNSVNTVTIFFEAPSNIADDYGQRMRGWIKAPTTGNYFFWIASDDNSELHLSADASPDNMQMIAYVPGWTMPREWDKYPQQQSAPVYLVAGEYYYIMALMKEGYGDDNLAVGWQIPGVGFDQPIGGQYLFMRQSELHTNFSINAAGEELLLTHPNGSILDQVQPIALLTDVSYGRKPDGTGDWFLFAEPTPGATNNTEAFTHIQPPPVFSHQEGPYADPFQLSLQSDSGAVVYYTTNGQIPAPGTGTVYSSPIPVSGTIIIKAKAYREGYLPSPPVTKVYSAIDPELHNFRSNLPLIILHEFNTPISPGSRSKASAIFMEHNDGDSTHLLGEIALQSDILANIRGHSSQYWYPKKMYGIHMVDEYEMSRDESLFGLPAEHNWILNGPYSDKTLMRNAIAYELANGLGRWAPRTRFVEVFLHNGNGPVSKSDYIGLYILVERIKIGEDRVNITKLEPGDNAEPEISGGYILKKDRLNDGEQGMESNLGTLLAFVRPNEQNATPEQKNWIRNYINDLENTLYSPDFANPVSGYPAFIDVESFIDHFLLTELLKEIDGYRLSTFMYKNRNQRLVMGPAWDFNLSLGNADYLNGWLPQGWYYSLLNPNDCYIGCGVSDWYVRLLEDPAYVQKMNYRWWQLRQSLFSNENLSGLIENFSNRLVQAQVRNFIRWPILGQYVWPNWFIGQTYQQEVDWMHNWLMTRLLWMDSQMGEPPVFPDYKLIYYWLCDETLPNNIPLEQINASYHVMENASLQFHSALDGYPFYDGHPNWRKSSMERRNAPTGINYRPEGNNGVLYGESNMRGLQVRQPFTGDGGENTLYFQLPTTNYEDMIFRFAAKDEGAATHLLIDYSVSSQSAEWITAGLSSITWPLSASYQLYEIDFAGIEQVNKNAHFKIRIRFDGDDMNADNGDRVTFNNFSLEGELMPDINQPPVVSNPPGLQHVIEKGDGLQFNLYNIFNDPDGDPLAFQAQSNNEIMVEVLLNENTLTIHPMQRGEACITLYADDGIHLPVHHTFRVLVYPEANILKDGDFIFTFWHPDEAEYVYPENMIFLQSDVDDPGLNADLLYAYYIPHDDYHADDEESIGYPYNNTAKTRINGLGEDGISFINTGRNRDVGGALLALDTREVSSANISWLSGTLLQNSRTYGIRLQYRTSFPGTFANLIVDGQPVEYITGPDGETKIFSNILLPPVLLGKDYIQLLWRYYHIDGDAGSRAQLRLGEIQVNPIAGINELSSEWATVYTLDKRIYINISSNFEGMMNLYDLAGRNLEQKQIAGASTYTMNYAGASGLFIVQIVTNEQVLVRKVVVK